MTFLPEQYKQTIEHNLESLDEDCRRAHEAEILAEIAAELEKGDHLTNAGVEVVCFTSRSNGRDRRRRSPREVILVSYAGSTHQFSRERYPAYRNADSHAEVIYADHSDNGHDSYELYFNAVIQAISKH